MVDACARNGREPLCTTGLPSPPTMGMRCTPRTLRSTHSPARVSSTAATSQLASSTPRRWQMNPWCVTRTMRVARCAWSQWARCTLRSLRACCPGSRVMRRVLHHGAGLTYHMSSTSDKSNSAPKSAAMSARGRPVSALLVPISWAKGVATRRTSGCASRGRARTAVSSVRLSGEDTMRSGPTSRLPLVASACACARPLSVSPGSRCEESLLTLCSASACRTNQTSLRCAGAGASSSTLPLELRRCIPACARGRDACLLGRRRALLQGAAST
mmetsp:Transcript_19170/g.47098  ORF Transcript_19170/g.47098 Transcript_19170/m.47098 type:complete len:272 (+) Transcript_19170:716-1531(+)